MGDLNVSGSGYVGPGFSPSKEVEVVSTESHSVEENNTGSELRNQTVSADNLGRNIDYYA